MSAMSKVVAVIALPVVVLAGVWAIGAWAPSYWSSVVLTGVWFAVVLVDVWLLARWRPALRWWLVGAYAVTAVAATAGFVLTTLVDDEVDEEVVTASPMPAPTRAAERSERARTSSASRPARPPDRNVLLAAGRFESLEHETTGRAEVIELARGKGRKLTLTDFETDNGPDLFVYLSKGSVSQSSSGDDHVDLGELKGNVGDQQYDVPDDVDLREYDTVLIWCRAFSAGFAKAPLRLR